MKRVVVTGMGIVSSIGNDLAEVLTSLQEGKSGIAFNEEYKEKGFRSQVSGSIKNLDLKERIDRKQLRFMGDAAAYAYIAMQEAVTDSGLTEDQVSNVRTGIIAGSGYSISVEIKFAIVFSKFFFTL